MRVYLHVHTDVCMYVYTCMFVCFLFPSWPWVRFILRQELFIAKCTAAWDAWGLLQI